MTAFRHRICVVRAGGDQGSVLALALAFLLVFGLLIGVVLQFAATGQRIAGVVRDAATSTYAGGGALDGAVNAVRSSLTTGVDPGTSPIPASPCFTLPAGALDNSTTVTVSCRPRTGSGVSPASLADQPLQAVLAESATSSEGVALTGSAKVAIQGKIAVNKRIAVPAGATLSSTGAITAGDCTQATGSVTPSCTTAAAPGDPGWADPTAYPTVATSLPPCTSPLVTLVPGTYLSLASLQSVLNCTNTVVWFKPGVYYFDFRDASPSSHELVVGAGAVVVGGAASGWTPGTTSPGSVPYPSASSPSQSACDVSQPGVDLVFGGDSRLNVTGGKLQLCGQDVSTSNQHIVLRGLRAATSALPTTGPAVGTASAAVNSGTGTAWSSPGSGAVVDDATATVSVAKNKSSAALQVGPMTSPVVPAEATGITLTIKVTETLSGPGASTIVVRPGDGSAPLASQSLHDCATSPCTDTAFVSGKFDTVTVSGLTPAQVNGLSVNLTVTSPVAGATKAWVDGVRISAVFSAPMRPTSGTGVAVPYVSGSSTATALLNASGSYSSTVVALHGTVYAPLAAVDLGLTSVPYPVVDRGLVLRHLQLSMTPASGYGGPLLSIPPVAEAPRHILLTAADGDGVTLARADVTFANAAGTQNGSIPTVLEWSVS